MKNRDVEMYSGGITYVDSANPHGGIRSAFEVNIDLHLLGDIRDVKAHPLLLFRGPVHDARQPDRCAHDQPPKWPSATRKSC